MRYERHGFDNLEIISGCPEKFNTKINCIDVEEFDKNHSKQYKVVTKFSAAFNKQQW